MASYFNPDRGEYTIEIEAFFNTSGLVSIIMGESWLQLSPVCSKALAEQLCDATGDSLEAIFPPTPISETDDKSNLSTKEKNTLLILIAALCKEAKIDPNARGITPAIQKLTEQLGAPVGDDTIKKVLGQLQGAIDSRSK